MRDDPAEQPPPTNVEDGDAWAVATDARERDRDTVGCEREKRQVGLLGPEAVAGLTARAWLGAVHERRVNLPVECEPKRIGPDLRTQQSPVLVHAVDVVPTLILVKDKKAVSRLDGRTSAPRIEAMLEPHLPELAAA